LNNLSDEAYAILEGRHSDPFHYLGRHQEQGRDVVRAFIPGATAVSVVDNVGVLVQLPRIHDDGLFAGLVPHCIDSYTLQARFGEAIFDLQDPYRFPPILGDLDLYLLGEGTHRRLFDKLGAHPLTIDGADGVAFALWAPNARAVSLVGDFNGWDRRRHLMRVRGNGYWELFLPGVNAGDRYKFAITTSSGQRLPLKADPLAFAAEMRPSTASIILDQKNLPRVTKAPSTVNALSEPMSIYEIHLGSWRRSCDNSFLSYRDLAAQLPAYVKGLGFTHVELMPISEHPFDGSWGYQPTGMFAPTSRFGSPADFARLIDAFHREDIGVILDWVPGHFPDDPHGLCQFDGTSLYEHAHPSQGRHLDWGTLIYNYGRTEVVNFLTANALFWLERYGIDGLRVDAVASMLYLDYSRPEGGWIPNKYGGRENLEAIEFLRGFNRETFGAFPDSTTIAEESTAWPQVSRPIEFGGLGFGYKWNMGWMHDTLNYISKDPIHRKHHHDQILFGLHYAFSENFVLPLSHDEVVHGKRSILGRMPGDAWQRFANLRAYYGFMFGHPGKKLLFMGAEFGQESEWNHDQSLDWHLLDQAPHRGVQKLIGDLNALYRAWPALHELDADPSGFEWLIADDADHSVFAWLRKGTDGRDRCVVIANFTPAVLKNYRVRVPFKGAWKEVLNTDSSHYGGSNVGNSGIVQTQGELLPELELVLPPLAVLFLVPESS